MINLIIIIAFILAIISIARVKIKPKEDDFNLEGCNITLTTSNYTYKKGYVYLVMGKDNDIVKIGIASNLIKRLSSLNTGSPEELRIFDFIKCDNPRKIESELHQRYSNNRIKGEWFNIENEKILTMLNSYR